jgi:hypothetical protein
MTCGRGAERADNREHGNLRPTDPATSLLTQPTQVSSGRPQPTRSSIPTEFDLAVVADRPRQQPSNYALASISRRARKQRRSAANLAAGEMTTGYTAVELLFKQKYRGETAGDAAPRRDRNSEYRSAWNKWRENEQTSAKGAREV